MTENSSLLDNLMRRRVLPIVGMYVAATWLVIELGDWVTERFNFPANLTSYVFVAMLVMLPAVILFAYNHGAPGKDRWTSAEKIVVPLNVVLAIVVLVSISPLLIVEAATETVRLPDETGVIQEFEVARQGHHREVIGFFWRNDTGNADVQWLSYGLPLMLAHDLNRVSPVITVATPFHSFSIRSELRSKGYESFLNEPQGLQVNIARDRRSAALIVGSYSEAGEARTIDVTLIDAESGDIVGTHSVTDDDWLAAVDEVSFAILEYLDVTPSDNQSNDPISRHFSASLEAIEHYTNGQAALDINNDYPLGISELQTAVELDPGFAEASGALSYTYYLSGDVESARATASQALNNSYRLSETNKFLIKTNRYIYDGDFDSGERVLDVWTQVQPNSTQAFSSLARLSKLRGSDDSLDKASAAYDRLLELDPKDYGVYRQKAEVEQQRGDFEAAAAYIKTFLDYEPDSGAAHLQLAYLHQAQGDLEAAHATLMDAAILSDDPLESELGLARLEARRGFYDQAEERLSGQLNDQPGSLQRLQVLGAQAEVAVARGRIATGIALHEEMDEVAEDLMPPMIRLVRIKNEIPTLLVLLGKPDEAIALTDEIVAQLQPPLDTYLNFSYTTIYGETEDRESFREWADKTSHAQDQLPEIFQPFIGMQSAQLAIWDEDFDLAVSHLDRAKELLGQSLIQLAQDNLGTSVLHVVLAALYLDAKAIDKSEAQLEGVLKVFPADAFAKLVLAKSYIVRADEDAARTALDEALEIWSEADPEFILRKEAISLRQSL